MATVFTHALVGAAIGHTTAGSLPRVRLGIACALAAMLPDADVVAFRLGIAYEHPLGHRGLSHSLLFAAVVGPALGWGLFRPHPAWPRAATALGLALASHGFFDALTDGGLGVGFLLPFVDERYFFPVRPLAVSPIRIDSFLSWRGVRVLFWEFVVVWLPILAGALALRWRRQR